MRHLLLTISLIFGATAASANDHLPAAGEILQRGKVVYEFPHISKPVSNTEVLEFVLLYVIYEEEFYICDLSEFYALCEIVGQAPTKDHRNKTN